MSKALQILKLYLQNVLGKDSDEGRINSAKAGVKTLGTSMKKYTSGIVTRIGGKCKDEEELLEVRADNLRRKSDISFRQTNSHQLQRLNR